MFPAVFLQSYVTKFRGALMYLVFLVYLTNHIMNFQLHETNFFVHNFNLKWDRTSRTYQLFHVKNTHGNQS